MGGFLGAVFQGYGQHLDLSLFEFMTGSQDRAVTSLSSYQYTGESPIRISAWRTSPFGPVMR